MREAGPYEPADSAGAGQRPGLVGAVAAGACEGQPEVGGQGVGAGVAAGEAPGGGAVARVQVLGAGESEGVGGRIREAATDP